MSTTTLPAAAEGAASVLERVVLQGDLSKLTAQERVRYYAQVCESLGLNPLTKPFEYLLLKGERNEDKLVLYATRTCTDQLRRIHGITITILSREQQSGVYTVTARAADAAGRADEATGAVAVEREQGEWRTAQSGKRFFAGTGEYAPLRGDALANAVMKAECVPLDSEILTRNGFGTHDCLTLGEEVLAYDCARNVTEWVPLENVSVYRSAAVERLSTVKGQFQVVCTADHSWAVRRQPYKPDGRGNGERGPRGPYQSRGPERFLVKANEIKTSHRLILSASCADAGASLLSPIEAAVLGWAVTDGTIKWVGNSVRIGLCQSKDAHKPAIRQLVEAAAGQVRELVTPAGFRTFPMTGRTYATKPQHWWYLPAAVSRALLEKAGFTCRADLPRIVTRLDAPAREAMLGAMMAAEGDARRNFFNTDRHIIEAFQILCALQGFATGALRQRPSVMVQRLKKNRHLAGCFLRMESAGSCPVWCPTTRHGTWVMRQQGQVMITGNTKAKRRVTLSICGLGWLDESEVDSAPGARRVAVGDGGEIAAAALTADPAPAPKADLPTLIDRIHREIARRPDKTWLAALRWAGVQLPEGWKDPTSEGEAQRRLLPLLPQEAAERILAAFEPNGKKVPPGGP